MYVTEVKMKKRILLFILGIFLIGSCSMQNQENLVGKGSEVPQPPQQNTQSPASNPQLKEFKITAKQYSFEPSIIEVNKGDKVRLIVTSVDIPHGITIKEYGINQRLDVGRPETIEFTADKPGTFTAFCSVFCGSGHSGMKGKLVVN